MTVTAIRQKLYQYIKEADDKQVKAFYTIITMCENESGEWWENEKMVEELKAQDADMDSGKDPGVLWQDAKQPY